MQDIMITGFPRSGTSYFCSLLNKIPNVVVVNEPEEDFPLFTADYAQNMTRYYQQLRSRILRGESIGNKLVQDTTIDNSRQPWRPNNLTDEHFILGTKKTIKYLLTLTKYFEAQQPIKVVVLIRHPLPMISSWKRSFEHLRQVDIRPFRTNEYQQFFFSAQQQAKVRQIESQSDLSLKRALFWNFLADCILSNRENVTFVRYEELIEKPNDVISRLLGLPHTELAGIISKSHQKASDLSLSEKDILTIKETCRVQAIKLGYDL